MLCGGMACGHKPPTQESVAAEFRQAHPDLLEVNVRLDDGDSQAAYFDIHYKRPGDPTPHVDHWTYERQPKGPWKLKSTRNLK